jgi:hypothetical protein
MRVNQAVVARYLDKGTLLGPGRVGVHAFSFGDVAGDPAAALFSSFVIAKLR